MWYSQQLLEIVCACVFQDSPAAKVVVSSYVTVRKEEGGELSGEEEGEEEEEVIYPTLNVPSDVDPWYLLISCTIVCKYRVQNSCPLANFQPFL